MSNQLAPDIQIDAALRIAASTKSQQRGQHGLYRYFGKLAPDVTGAVLDIAAGYLPSAECVTVVDPMCGSGTTLIEAADRGWSSIGSDINPVSRLYSRTKTTAIDADIYRQYRERVLASTVATDSEVEKWFAGTRNAERWFTDASRREVAALRRNIEALPPSAEAELLLASLLSRLRRISNASERTGRIFYDPASARSAVDEFAKVSLAASDAVPASSLDARVLACDARALDIDEGTADIVLVHPPYFALYRYSSDVLRFELEIGGFSRREVANAEIREGWKSGDPENLNGYLADMGSVFAEAQRVSKDGAVLAVVASNSTLGDIQLPVIDGLVEQALRVGFSVLSHIEREAHHGSASYHRSARTDKVISRDHVLVLRKN